MWCEFVSCIACRVEQGVLLLSILNEIAVEMAVLVFFFFFTKLFLFFEKNVYNPKPLWNQIFPVIALPNYETRNLFRLEMGTFWI